MKLDKRLLTRTTAFTHTTLILLLRHISHYFDSFTTDFDLCFANY